MEITTQIELTKQELWDLIESLPSSRVQLLAKLNQARVAFERKPIIYGRELRIRYDS